MNYTIALTETENYALSYIAVSQEEWINNAVHERCRVAADKIVDITVKYCLDKGIQVPPTREDSVEYAVANGIVKTAAERKAEAEAQENS